MATKGRTNWADGKRPRNLAERQHLQNRADLGRLLIAEDELTGYIRNLERVNLQSEFLPAARLKLMEIAAAIRTTEAKIAAFDATREEAIESARDEALKQELRRREIAVRDAELHLSKLRADLREFKASILAEGVTIESSLA